MKFHLHSEWQVNSVARKKIIFIIVEGLSDEEALKHIQNLFPEYKGRIYQVQMRSIVKRSGGALNCLSWTFTI